MASARVQINATGDNIIQFTSPYLQIQYNGSNTVSTPAKSYDADAGTATFASKYMSKADQMIFSNSVKYAALQDYLPDVYDYYLVFTAYANCDTTAFTFAPTAYSLVMNNCDGTYPTYSSKMSYYHHDLKDAKITGFTITALLPTLTNLIPEYLYLRDSTQGTITSADINTIARIIRVEKGGEVDVTPITTALNTINKNISSSTSSITSSVTQQGQVISGAIEDAQQAIQDKIDSQYEMSDSEDFGIDGLQQTVEDKMGVLAFASNTTSDLLNLFKGNSTRASYDTTITFPSFQLKIQGETYKIWDEYVYDFSDLEEQVPMVVTAIRTFTVLTVWSTLLSYLMRVYRHFIGGE